MVKSRIQNVYENVREALESVTDDAGFEALELLGAVCGLTRQDLLMGRDISLSETQQKKLDELVRRRLDHEPLQYLLGEWDFFGRTFSVGEGVLIPRGDTEPLVEACLELIKRKHAPRILDLCTGSGCIGITLALERPDAEVWAVEKSPQAFSYFQKNNQSFGSPVRGILGDALNPALISGNFDLIVSNPPYLTRSEMDALQPEVTREPAMALYGQDDGLYFYKEFCKIYPQRLNPGGALAFEIGDGQQSAVCGFLTESGMISICQKHDLHGIIRVITARNKLSGQETPAET